MKSNPRPFSMLAIALALSLTCSLPAFAALPGSGAPTPKEKVTSKMVATASPSDFGPSDFQETIHGQVVADPYRWMEDIDSPRTKAWVERERQKAESYLAKLPHRAEIRQYLEKIQNYPRYSLPTLEAGRYFFTRNSGLQNQSVLYMSSTADGQGQVILDPNTLSKDGTVALTNYEVSPGAKYLAYSTAKAGSDWNEIRVLDLATKETLKDKIEWVKFSTIVWDREGQGFFYSRYPAPESGQSATIGGLNEGHTLYYHRLGQPQSADQVIFSNPDNPDLSVYGASSEDKRWLIVQISQPQNDNTALLVKDMTNPQGQFITLPNSFQARFDLVDVYKDRLFVRTDWQAPKGRVLSVKLTNNVITTPWEEVIPQSEEPLSQVSCVGGKLYANYLHDATSRIKEYTPEGEFIKDLQLPGLGTVSGFYGKNDAQTAYYAYTSFNTPAVIYAYDIASGKSTIWHQPQLNFDPQQIVTKQVFVPSSDGAKVPLFISYRRDVKLDGQVPTLLYGYGGFAIDMTPGFSTRAMTWMQMGGIYAQASLRGGAEYGEEWHRAGTKTKKQHTFDDFINCAQWLVDNKYTKPQRLAINGGSNGGLLVGACLNQRPDLFGAAVPQVGVMDMLRFQEFTIGRYWMGDYGDVKKPEEFATLYKISPYHNIKPGTKYPATLVTTADHDDRVYPAHSFKYAAQLQRLQAGPAPILIRIDSKAGHGAGKPIAKSLDETADILAFIAQALGFKDLRLPR